MAMFDSDHRKFVDNYLRFYNSLQPMPKLQCCAYHILTEDMSRPCAGTPNRYKAPLPREYVKA